MRISKKGINLIARFEGCRLQAYRCATNLLTIGYGHTKDVVEGMVITQEQAEEMLVNDAYSYAKYVEEYCENGIISFELNQNQFDALTSFAFNCGKGNLKNLVSGRDAATVARKMLEYNKADGNILKGLQKRRYEEQKLFLEQ